ncbi:MAG: hypothetical protein HOG49_42520 [Candidatus Scalindua sp.]|jgi:uncharacterized protein YjbI with pentapeptide repeats|nr:hypothetical protein [Candidatus Scalindua sp.]
MADLTRKEVIEKVRKGESFKSVVLKHIDLSSADLSDANFSGANLSGANLSGVNLSNANLVDAVVECADLSNANLSGALLCSAGLQFATLTSADIRKTDLSTADLNGANLSGANLFRANLRKANLSEADLNGANLSNAKLISADLIEAELNDADLSNADFSYALLISTDLRDANLSGTNLGGSILSEAHLNDANLISANLRDAVFSGANLSGANLSGVNLNYVDFSSADLSNANLSDADLRHANLRNAHLCNANLRGAILISVDLEDAYLTNADISGANIFHYKTHGWKIEGIKCTHVYNCPSGTSKKDREKSRINFRKSEFEAKYKEMPTIELVLSGGLRILDILKMNKIIEKMNKMYNAGLELSEMKSELNGIAYTLKAKSDDGLEEVANNLLLEYKNCDIDGKLLKIFRKEKLLSTGVEGIDINSPDIDVSKVFGKLSGAAVHLSIGTVNIIHGGVKGNAVAIGQGATATTIIDNYAKNKKQIDQTLKEFKKEVSEEIQKQIEELTGALKKKSEKEALGAWDKIKKLFTKADEAVETVEKATTLPQRVIGLYQTLEGWFEAGLNLM